MPYVTEVLLQRDGFLMLTAKGMNEDIYLSAGGKTDHDRRTAFHCSLHLRHQNYQGCVAYQAELVYRRHRMISPDQEKSMAKQMKAMTTILPSSYVAMQSRPREVAAVIEHAAAGKSD